MASGRQSSAYLEPLPPRPSLEMQQKRAKELLRAAWARDVAAIDRIRALHPKPPDPDALKLTDAQLVVARGYGFESWAAMKRKIESLTVPPIDQFFRAVDAGDIDCVRELLASHPEVQAAINEPRGHFDGRAVMMARTNLPLLDVLLAHGADLNLKSLWWAGGFGVLESGITAQEAAHLIERGAVVDIFGAAHLGMFDRVRELVDADPSLVHARGGDGKTALHCATTVEIARYLVDRGADVNARDVDHESTPAQYLVREAPDVVRFLIARGARVDIFMAVALRDPALVEQCLREDTQALDHRTGQGLYAVAHDGRHAATREEIGNRRGDTYRWVFDHNVSALDVAAGLGDESILNLLLAHATPAQRLLAACARGDHAAAQAVVAAHPALVSGLAGDQMRLIADRAQANDTAAVSLMIGLGFDPRVPGPSHGTPLHWAAFHGNSELVRRLLQHDPPIGQRDAEHGGTPLGWCLYGAVNGWGCWTGDFPSCVRRLIEAGERPEPADLPTGRDDVDVVLRAHFAASERT
jgi:ankyrin repeat protein